MGWTWQLAAREPRAHRQLGQTLHLSRAAAAYSAAFLSQVRCETLGTFQDHQIHLAAGTRNTGRICQRGLQECTSAVAVMAAMHLPSMYLAGTQQSQQAAAAPQPAHVRPPADELADLFTSLTPGGGGGGGGSGSGGASFPAAAPSHNQAPGLQGLQTWQTPHLLPQQPQQQQPALGLWSTAGHQQPLANGGGSQTLSPGSGSGALKSPTHARKSSGSSAFEDLDIDVRFNQRPMQGASDFSCCTRTHRTRKCHFNQALVPATATARMRHVFAEITVTRQPAGLTLPSRA